MWIHFVLLVCAISQQHRPNAIYQHIIWSLVRPGSSCVGQCDVQETLSFQWVCSFLLVFAALAVSAFSNLKTWKLKETFILSFSVLSLLPYKLSLFLLQGRGISWPSLLQVLTWERTGLRGKMNCMTASMPSEYQLATTPLYARRVLRLEQIVT